MQALKSYIRKNKRLLSVVRYILYWTSNFGIELPRILAIRAFPAVVREYFILKRMNKEAGSKWKLRFSMPSLHDRYEESGIISGHYFHQDLLVARRIFQRQPVKHVDVASRVETFVAHVAAFRAIEVFDIRPLDAKIKNITFKQCDFMNFPKELLGYADSVSCLHALEHFGLGRYNDPMDIDGHLKGFDSLYKILAPGGILYLSFPIGEERIEFNAHRVFAIKTVLEWAKDRFELIGFSYVDDAGDLHEDVVLTPEAINTTYNLDYGCGIFELKKLPVTAKVN
ncbi:DUF268 domain-containing protein [Bdellovibrio sp. HCB337]|uniref:DUF268 domain-containing protein n=1 Tax=Bdellovibrio sp. HCB337 TaxID=3394358 RepID=UPI0039A5E417